ncbi:MAG: phospholipase D-like domain-containing protein [Wenzhouxiangellaceae bacterium]|nr:phospholipase D-like domain-containing protein [Wenzhouxiangellaceae bacterium]
MARIDPHLPGPLTLRRIVVAALLLFVLAWIGMGAWHRYKPLPPGISVAQPVRPAGELRFLADRTWIGPDGERHVDHVIFDRVIAHVEAARQLVVMDWFLFNDFAGTTAGDDMRPLSDLVADAVVRARRRPDAPRVILVTDPINVLYGGLESARFERLREAGVDIVLTDLDRLRDSNPLWSGLWRVCCSWAGNSAEGGWLPNPVGKEPVTLRTVLRILNFKANHRKTLVADSGDDWVGLVTSGNPHDASSAHGNVGVEFTGPAALDLLETEHAVAAFSAPGLDWPSVPSPASASPSEAAGRVQVLTEARIRDAVLDGLARSGPGDRVDLAMFYLSDRDVVEGLVGAHERGASVRALLDPNEGAFGREKSGIPNRPVAAELHEAGLDVRWCRTFGEQCHSKAILFRRSAGDAEFIAGSANFTRRNLDDLNLETDVRVLNAADSAFMTAAAGWFEERWTNAGGRGYSVAYDRHADQGFWKWLGYRVTEATGMSTY